MLESMILNASDALIQLWQSRIPPVPYFLEKNWYFFKIVGVPQKWVEHINVGRHVIR